jgi:Flp pilus assembly protein CpaB
MELAQRMLATRGGTVTLGAFAALLAGLVLLVYLNQYRNSVDEAAVPVPVLVAKSLIERGTPGDAVARRQQFQATDAPKGELKDGAIADPSILRGQVAVHDVFPGQQLTTADFVPTGSDSIGARLVKGQRAISVPVDSAHGIVGNTEAGDRVDVYASFPEDDILKIVLQNALVLDAPDGGRALAGGATANVVIRATYGKAAEIAFAADNGKVWLVLRPRTGAGLKRPGVVTQESVVRGINRTVVNGRFRSSGGGAR